MKLFKRSTPTVKFTERYTLGAKLGAGAFSIVYDCTRRGDEAHFAAKVIDKGKMKGKSQAVQNEIDVLGSLDHENIVKLIEFIDEKK